MKAQEKLKRAKEEHNMLQARMESRINDMELKLQNQVQL